MATSEELEAKIRQQYPSYVYLLDQPELKQLLLDAVDPDKGFSAEEFQAKFQATNWYRTHGDTQRQWEALLGSDPASAERQIQQKTAEITDLVAGMGLPGNWNNAFTRQIADTALRMGLTAAELRDYVIQFVPTTAPGATPTGDMGATYNEVRRLARSEYLVPLSDQDAWQWTMWIANGSTTLDGYKASLGDAAKGRFPHLADLLEQGIPPGQYFAPYRQMIAQELEIGSDAVDLMDPKWADILSTPEMREKGPKGGSGGGIQAQVAARPHGGTRTMTLSEAQSYVRSKSEWQSTSRAREMAAGLGSELLRTFGALA
jgi:hypothetical protein